MTRKDNLLLLFAIPLLGAIFACDHKDPYWQDPIKPINNETEATLRISIPQARQIIRSGGSQDPALSIESLYFLFFEGKEPSSQILEVKVVTSKESIAQGSYEVKLPKRSYELLVLANPTPHFTDLCKEGVRLEAITTPVERSKLHANKRHATTNTLTSVFPLMMGNSQGLVSVEETHFGENPTKKLTVDVEISHARFVVTNYPAFAPHIKDLYQHYHIASIGNTRNQFPLRRLAKLANGQEERLGDGSLPVDRYAYSYKYDEIASATTAEAVNAILKDIRPDDLTITDEANWLAKDASLQDKINYPSAYRAEHTVSEMKHWRGLVPHLIVVFKLAPEGLTPDKNEGWISYRKQHYMLERDFKTILETIVKKQTVTVEMKKGFPEEFISECQEMLTKKNVTSIEQFLGDAFCYRNIRFYKQSQNLYFFPVRHFNNSQAPNQDSYGRYGIVRGNEYTFTFTNTITDFGEPVVNDLLQDMSPLVEEVSSSFTIKTQPLVSRQIQEL